MVDEHSKEKETTLLAHLDDVPKEPPHRACSIVLLRAPHGKIPHAQDSRFPPHNGVVIWALVW